MSGEIHGGALRFIANRSSRKTRSDTFDEVSLQFTAHTLKGPDEGAVVSIKPVTDKDIGSIEISPRAKDLFLEIERGLDPLSSKFNDIDDNAWAKSFNSKAILYDRIVDDVTANDLPSEKALKKLASAMKDLPAINSPSRIPAAFTYFGQIIAHDMTLASFDPAIDAFVNYKKHALNFDSILDQVDIPPSELSRLSCKSGQFCLGSTTYSGRYEDLPRDDKGSSYLADKRNDNNLVVAQMTVALIKFYRKICVLLPSEDDDVRKMHFRQHLHSIVLHDYLKEVCDDEVYCDVMSYGRRLLQPGKTPVNYLVPAEFSGACFRFGHSQVKARYEWNDDHAIGHISELLTFCKPGGGIYPNLPNLRDSWVIDWNRFFPLDGKIDEPQPGQAIDPYLAYNLRNLPTSLIYDKLDINGSSFDLAELTLLRGRSMLLPTSQMLVRELRESLPADAPEFKSKEDFKISPLRDVSFREFIKCNDCASEIECKTPLWYFVLQEAASGKKSGKALGPIASRIVMETIHCSIHSVDDTVINRKFSVLNGLHCSNKRVFKFEDLLRSI